MFRSLRHHLSLAIPLLALTALIAAASSVLTVGSQIASAAPVSGLTATLADGVDELTVRLQPVLAAAAALLGGSGSWIAVLALAATAASVVSALHQLSEWIHGPADVSSLVRHVAQRAGQSTGINASRVSWGVVRDATTGAPLPLARVSVLDGVGRVYATSVSDGRGEYGFPAEPSELLSGGGVGGFIAARDGFHDAVHSVPVHVRRTVNRLDISLQPDRQRSRPEPSRGTLGRAAATAAFWTGVVTVPMAALAAPAIVGPVTVALFAGSAIVRAVSMHSAAGHDGPRTP